MTNNNDTIFALATPFGKGAIFVVRVSGPRTQELINILAQKSEDILLNPRKQIYTAISYQGEILDYSLLTYFERGRSYTGEDSLELSIHASSYIIKALSLALIQLGAREARAGEFTERAYLNGKLDLTQAEAVCDLINAETKAQARASREQLEGRLGTALDSVGEPLRDILAEIEAHIDFPDEDINPSKPKEWVDIVRGVLLKINEFLDSYAIGRLYREGALIVLAGVPNAGKSSLMNTLLREERVIVTDIPGTTRDTIEEQVELGGVLCRIVDTAGLASEIEEHGVLTRQIDPVEKIGITRSFKFIEQADLVLFLFDRTQDVVLQLNELENIKKYGREILLILSKRDACEGKATPLELAQFDKLEISVLANNKAGIKELESYFTNKFVDAGTRHPVIFTNSRHQKCLESSKDHLNKFIGAINSKEPLEIVSFELRTALSCLAEIVGNTETEDILGRIFSKFCIGK